MTDSCVICTAVTPLHWLFLLMPPTSIFVKTGSVVVPFTTHRYWFRELDEDRPCPGQRTATLVDSVLEGEWRSMGSFGLCGQVDNEMTSLIGGLGIVYTLLTVPR